MAELITSKDIPAADSPNNDPTMPEFEPLGLGELLAISIEQQDAPRAWFYGGIHIADLRIGDLRPNSPVEPRELQIIRVADMDNPNFKELLARAQKSDAPISGLVMLALPKSTQKGVSAEAATLLANYGRGAQELILGRGGNLQWYYFGPGTQYEAVSESPYHDNDTISSQQLRIGYFGNRLLFEGLTENSDIEIKTALPHGKISSSLFDGDFGAGD